MGDTIEHYDEEDEGLPRPMSLKDVIILKKSQQNKSFLGYEEKMSKINGDSVLVTKKMNYDDEKKLVSVSIEIGMSHKKNYLSQSFPDEIKVVKDYTRRPFIHSNTQQYVQSPLTNEIIAVNDMEEHMRLNLIDPRWRDQKKSMLDKIKQSSTASDDEIAFNIQNLAQNRPDIFGSTHHEKPPSLLSNVTAEVETQSEHIIHCYSKMNCESLKPISTKDQVLNTYYEAPCGNCIDNVVSTDQLLPNHLNKNNSFCDVFKSKKMTISKPNSLLKCSGTQLVRVHCEIPQSDTTFCGNNLEIHIQSLEIKVVSLKDRIMEIIGISSSKQKISMPGIGVLLDNNSLSSYNFEPGSVLLLEKN